MRGARVIAAAVLALLAACAAPDEQTPPAPDNGAETPSETPSETPGPGETGGICGGIAGFQCAGEDEYCQMAPGECKSIADAAGTCTVKPQICTREYRPVCGCDGETYSNKCEAAAAGVSVASDGMCTE